MGVFLLTFYSLAFAHPDSKINRWTVRSSHEPGLEREFSWDWIMWYFMIFAEPAPQVFRN